MGKKLNTATSIEEIQRIPTLQERFRFVNEKKKLFYNGGKSKEI